MDRFIVGTGRCGSTLLSRMLAENSATLSLFEYFNGLDVFRRLQPEPVTGDEFAELIGAEQRVVTAVLRRGYEVAEITYPFEGAGRYSRQDSLPWILVSMLPRLSDDPDALFDEVMRFCRSLPSQPPVRHHRALFGWLCRRLGRDHWIERSGSSIDYLEALTGSFPQARFLHIHRDGYEAALSMREHHAYRLPIAILYGAAEGVGPSMSEVDFDAPPDCSDAVSEILAGQPAVAYYGRYWSDQVVRGFRALPGLDPHCYLEVRFEDLVAKPAQVLAAICQFFELEGGDWLERAAGLVGGISPSRFPGLPASEQVLLREACAPGRALLGQDSGAV